MVARLPSIQRLWTYWRPKVAPTISIEQCDKFEFDRKRNDTGQQRDDYRSVGAHWGEAPCASNWNFLFVDKCEQMFYNVNKGGETVERVYAAIDLKSFYASVECIHRGLDPMSTNLVVADQSRTDKTICLAVSPSLKKFGVPSRPRLFEVVQKVAVVNAMRREKAPRRTFKGASSDARELEDPALSVDYIVAPPRMAAYMEMSAKIYKVYLRFIAPEDIHIYSVDEVFLDLTHYLKNAKKTPEEYVRRMIRAVYEETGITATAGIGPNLFLCKVAMDVVAKKMEPDAFGARLATLTEQSYRRLLWDHKPITDIWRVGPGTARRLERYGLKTMGDVAWCSVHNEELLYRQFGVNAELLIDHAWGYEPVTMAQIKSYRPETKSLCTGQVLHCPYAYEQARLIVKEMTDLLALDLVGKGLTTDQLVLTIGYDRENTEKGFAGTVVTDHYGRQIPKHGHGTVNLMRKTSSGRLLTQAVMELFDRIADPDLTVRRINIAANHLVPADFGPQQLNFFDDATEPLLERENRRQRAVLGIKERFGKNAIVKAMNLQEGATAMDRNRQIGGHKA